MINYKCEYEDYQYYADIYTYTYITTGTCIAGCVEQLACSVEPRYEGDIPTILDPIDTADTPISDDMAIGSLVSVAEAPGSLVVSDGGGADAEMSVPVPGTDDDVLEDKDLVKDMDEYDFDMYDFDEVIGDDVDVGVVGAVSISMDAYAPESY